MGTFESTVSAGRVNGGCWGQKPLPQGEGGAPRCETAWEGEGLDGRQSRLFTSRICSCIVPKWSARISNPCTSLARELRQRSTDAEWKLWAILRNRQLGGFKFRRQVPIDRYFADFACLDARLIIELDGSQHRDRAEYDAARTATLQALGWRVLRFHNGEVFESAVGVGDTILLELSLPRA